MKITFDWLKDHLDTKLNEGKLLEQLTNVGLEVESVENLSAGLDLFKVAKILKTEKHPNADRLKVCDVDVGEKENQKSCVWCTQCKRRINYNICSSRSHCSKK
jgi:phenylalanyl-tRNA synthetase beta chain